MLIITQNNNQPINVDYVVVENKCVKGVKFNSCEVLIGSYFSHKRALDVLSDICKRALTNDNKVIYAPRK